MRIAIIGGGFTGLSAAYQLSKQGHSVTVYEKDPVPGGLAIGFKENEWDWTFEKHYHHWFTNDNHILGLAKEIGHNVIIKRPKSCVYVDGEIFQFDSPKEILRFPKLTLMERLRMAAVVGAIRYNPFWKPLEKINASTFLPKAMGSKAYKMIWEPQFLNKFGKSADDVSLAWLWARIAKRTPSLAYPEGGFLAFTNHLVKAIEALEGKVIFNAEIVEVKDNKKATVKYQLQNKRYKTAEFDKVIFTLSSFLFLKIAPQLTETYKKKFQRLKNLGATNLVLRLKQPFLKNNTYWLSICDTSAPVMVIAEHTNFMDKRHYNNEHLVYLGNYYETDNPRYLMSKEEKLKLFDPFLKKINPNYKNYLIGTELFKAPFAQPVIPTNYSKMIPSMKTPLKNVYLANMQQVYPWDRGTNYAVELGEKVAKLVIEDVA
jgi:protoporphyrinogen oxidase